MSSFIIRYPFHQFGLNFLTLYLLCEGRSISDFGYSEIELVLSQILKRMWKDNPQQISQDFFNRIKTPSWRIMKFIESLLLAMKSNTNSDFSLNKQTHAWCLSAFNETSALQVGFHDMIECRWLNGL